MDRLAEVRSVVDAIPAGTVMAYGDIAAIVGVGPRQAGRLVAALDDNVPWWRVVYADGTPATCHDGAAPDLLRREGVPFRGARVDRGAVDRSTRQGG
ncbi:MAG TPA: MGMT family protein [Arthrobacter sp.]|nr:MGMT family protein [Arthrobacter sp.]